jgi:hypothetical protein
MKKRKTKFSLPVTAQMYTYNELYVGKIFPHNLIPNIYISLAFSQRLSIYNGLGKNYSQKIICGKQNFLNVDIDWKCQKKVLHF